MTDFHAGRSQDEVGVETGESDVVVDLILLKGKGFDDVFDFKFEQIDEEDFVIEGHHDFIDSYFDLLDFGGEGHVSDDLLGF
jgi:hypothetical protein